jgi:hypothetical protein
MSESDRDTIQRILGPYWDTPEVGGPVMEQLCKALAHARAEGVLGYDPPEMTMDWLDDLEQRAHECAPSYVPIHQNEIFDLIAAARRSEQDWLAFRVPPESCVVSGTEPTRDIRVDRANERTEIWRKHAWNLEGDVSGLVAERNRLREALEKIKEIMVDMTVDELKAQADVAFDIANTALGEKK